MKIIVELIGGLDLSFNGNKEFEVEISKESPVTMKTVI